MANVNEPTTDAAAAAALKKEEEHEEDSATGGAAVEDEDTGAQVAPIVKLKEVAVTTGEEDEDSLIDLYVFLVLIIWIFLGEGFYFLILDFFLIFWF